MLHILLLETIEEESFEWLSQDLNIQLYRAWEEMPSSADMKKMDAVITRGIGQVNLALYDACPNLKVAARCGVGPHAMRRGRGRC
jgi:lactate dehydrogenase-like 2-hydroxyacid dehydrogenase